MEANKKRLWPAFLAAFLVYGVPYWLVPYNRLESAILSPALLGVLGAAAHVRAQRIASMARTTKVIGSSVLAVFIVRVIVDCSVDPTNHNLWPFEMIIALLVGMPAALLGAWAGGWMARSSQKDG